MGNTKHDNSSLPTTRQMRLAVETYLKCAYPDGPPEAANKFIPPDSSLTDWLMSDFIERDPPKAQFDGVRSFIMRMGNCRYPHMKLRLSRPPKDDIYVFSVDCHDAFLHAPAGSPDKEALEELKKHNAAVAAAVNAAWADENLPTERSYLRQKILQETQKAESKN